MTLNSEKRKAIADVFQTHFELNSPKYELHKKSITDYNEARTKMKVLAETSCKTPPTTRRCRYN
jgi:hypothetical protein